MSTISTPRLEYYVIYKPFNVLSQFTAEQEGQQTLKDVYDFPKDVYPVGRLDKDSEGLLLLTNDKNLNHQLLHPKNEHPRTYWVQVEGLPTQQALQQLRAGVSIKVNKKVHQTLPAKVRLLPKAPKLPERNPPVRFRKTVPDAWLEISLHEGKNRQVRRMTAKVGFPTLRLVRAAIVEVKLDSMDVGEVRMLTQKQAYRWLGLV